MDYPRSKLTIQGWTENELRERASRLRRYPGSEDFKVRGVSNADLNRDELRLIEKELRRRKEAT